MKYEFLLEDYWDTIEAIYEHNEDKGLEFKQIKIQENGDSEFYAYGYRIVIPELNLTVRQGLEYYKNSQGEEEPVDLVYLYDGDEKDPLKFTEGYCYTSVPSLIGMRAKDKKLNENPKCYIDDSEFEFWT